MSIYQRILKIIAICLIAFGAVEIILGPALGLVASVLASSEVQQLILAETEDAAVRAMFEGDPTEVLATLLMVGTALFIGGIVSVIAGIFGVRAVRRPSKTAVFTVFNVILFVLSLMVAIDYVVSPNIDPQFAVLFTLPALLQILAFVCTRKIHSAYKSGELADDWFEGYSAKMLAEGRAVKLGFLRVIQVWFGLCIVGSLFLCMFLVSGNYQVDLTFIIMFINLVCMGLSSYLIFKRYKMARFWIIGVSAFNIIVGTAGVLIDGDFSIFERLTTCGFDIFLILYFCLAKTPKKVLTNDFNLEDQKKEIIEAWDLWKPKTWDFWRAMIIYYCLFSIVGHWMEACYCLTIKYGIMPGTYDPTSGIWRDYLNPFPVYGAGMVACGLLLYPIKTKLQEKFKGNLVPLILSFVVNALVCTIMEFTLGMLCNADLSLWNYSDMAFNFMGQVCLLNACLFGAVATLMTWIVYPALQKLYLKMPNDIKKTFFAAVVAFYAVVVCLYVVNLG